MKYFKGNPLRVGSRAAARVLIGLLLCALCQVSCECSAASCSPVSTGLVGWWAAEGNANDVLGLGNGSLQGGATASATGVVGQAFSLDGTNGYVQIPDSPLLRPANLTVEGWVRFTSLDSPGSSPAGEQYIIFKQNTRSSEFAGFALTKGRGANGDRFEFRVSSAAGQAAVVVSVTQVTTGVWYHVAGVRGSNFLQLYVNGQLEGQTDVSFPQDYGNWPLYLGTTGQPAWDHKLAGLLDEVSLYGRALSASEIAGIFAAGSAGKCKAVNLTVQPQDQSVVAGGEAIFTVGATGFGVLGYQWQVNGVNIAGATGMSLVLTNVHASDAGSYRVVVTNLLSTVTSAAAVLTVLERPVITVPPVSQELVLRALPACTGGACASATFSAAATGTPPLSFQWQREGVSLANDGRITGATGNTLVLSAVRTGDAGSYTVVVSNAAGVTTSAVGVLIVTVPLIADLKLEDAVRKALSRPTGALTCSDLQHLTNLIVFDSYIVDLSGLECAVNLELLSVGGNYIRNLEPLRNLNRLSSLLLYNNHDQLMDISALGGLSNLMYLDIRSNPAISNLTEVTRLRSLTNLFLGGNGLGDIGFVTNLTELSSLDLNHNNITNLSPIAVLPKLRELDIGYNPVTNFAYLSGLTNLTSLYLSGNSVSNLAFLQNLSGLKSLSLYSNNIINILPLSGMAQLSWLNLGGNAVIDYSPLTGLTKLGSLWLYQNQLTNIPPLQALGQLKRLMLDDNRIAELRFGVLPAGLTSLSAERNRITNGAGLPLLTQLTELKVGGNLISDLSPLGNLSQLASLSLYSNRISEVSALAGLTNLAVLNLGANRLTNLAGFSAISNLSSLRLFGNAISDVGVLGQLSRLRYLDLQDNLITAASPLSNLFNLRRLDLGANPITKWSFLAGLTNVEEIGLERNSLAEASFLQPLTRLRVVNLDENLLTDLSALSSFTNLVSLSAEHNRLSDITGIKCLPRLGHADLRLNLLNRNAAARAMVECLTNGNVTINYEPQRRGPRIIFAALPTMSGSNYWPVAVNQSSSLGFSISDDVVADGQFAVTGSSSNVQLLPNGSLLLEGTSSDRSLTVTPSAGQSGNAVITLTAIDELGLSNSVMVLLSVSQRVVITDANLDAALRANLGSLTNELTEGALLSLTTLAAGEANITNLSGLEWATNLTGLFLNGNFISDCTFLQHLTNLHALSLNNNLLADLSPLAGLTNLTYLDVSSNPATNYSVFSGLTHLTELLLSGNSITNVSFLANLTDLLFLDLSTNRITDVSPLTALTNLYYLYLQQNRISNISALTNLLQLVEVDVRSNLLEPETDPALVALRAFAQVEDEPQRGPPSIDVRANWLIAAHSTSSLPFNVWDTGPSDEQLSLGIQSTNSDLICSLAPFGTNGYWVLTVTTPPDPAVTNAVFWVRLSATNDLGFSSETWMSVSVIEMSVVNGALLGKPDLAWTSGGNASWFGQNILTHNGHPVARSGSIGDDQESWLRTSLTGPGRLSFWWKVSSEENYDFFEFSLGARTLSVSGEVDWRREVVNVPPGLQTPAWVFRKDEAASSGLDAAWLDEVKFEPGIWLELAAGQTVGGSELILHAVPGKLYEVQTSTNSANWLDPGNWFRLPPVVLVTNVDQSFIDTNTAGANRLYRLHEVFVWLDPPSLSSVGMVEFVLHNMTGLEPELEVSNDLMVWTNLGRITNTAPMVMITQPMATNSPSRFYRGVVRP